jgi:hypothetical protein
MRNALERWMGRHPVGTSLILAIVALVWFGHRLHSTPHFVDESAFISQSYYVDLLLEGRRDAREWLEYPAVDLPPLPKYLVGLALRAIGQERPGPSAAWAWYRDTSRTFVPQYALIAARVPSAILGALGVLATYVLGTRLAGPFAGTLAAIFLMWDPLYALHARRAMADVPTEALVLLTAASALTAWSRCLQGRLGPLTWALFLSTGICAGLAVEAKLSGGMGLILAASWTALGLALPYVAPRPKLVLVAGFVLASATAFVVFVALNPTLTARPSGPLPPDVQEIAAKSTLGRVVEVVRFRANVSDQARTQFPHNALNTPQERVEAVLVQGLGRFSPLGPGTTDSTIRYDWRQDWAALLWSPLVFLGYVFAVRNGWVESRRRELPFGWALALMGLASFMVVAWFIPLAWDRYFLPIQASNALLAAYGLIGVFHPARAPRSKGAE